MKENGKTKTILSVAVVSLAKFTVLRCRRGGKEVEDVAEEDEMITSCTEFGTARKCKGGRKTF